MLAISRFPKSQRSEHVSAVDRGRGQAPPHVPPAGQAGGAREEREAQPRAPAQQRVDAGGGDARRVGEHEGVQLGAARGDREHAWLGLGLGLALGLVLGLGLGLGFCRPLSFH